MNRIEEHPSPKRNWFEEHPAKSIISYTVFIFLVTWGGFTFIVDENKVNLYKAETENYKSQVEQYKTRVELLQKEIDSLKMENKEYKDWLSKSENSLPIIVPKIVQLKKELDDVKKSNPQKELNNVKENNLQKIRTSNKRIFEIQRGISSFDEITGISLSIKNINTNRSASIIITKPDGKTENLEEIYAGYQSIFRHQERTFLLRIIEISWAPDSIKYEIIDNNLHGE